MANRTPFLSRTLLVVVVGLALAPLAILARQDNADATLARIRAEGLERSNALSLFLTLTDRFGARLTSEPEAQAEILTIMGRLYRRVGVYDKAQSLLEQALASGQRAYGPEHLRLAQTLNDLGALLTEKGDFAAAEQSLERSLAMRRALLGTEHADVAVTMVELGRIYQDRGFNERAEPLQREALAIRRGVLGEEDRETAVSLSDLASVLRLNGDLAGAESLLRQCLELNRKTRGEAHANTGTTLHDLGLIAASRRDYQSAETLFRQAMDIHRKALGERTPTSRYRSTTCRGCGSPGGGTRRRLSRCRRHWASPARRSATTINWSVSTRSTSRRPSLHEWATRLTLIPSWGSWIALAIPPAPIRISRSG